MRRRLAVGTFFALLVVSNAVYASTTPPPEPSTIEFDSERWTITQGQVVEHLGRQSLAGTAHLADLDFTDGVIDVDISMDGRRCFPGIIFRAESEANTEIFYLRPHRSINYSHALQYTPRFNGLTGWQLYSGPGFTSGVDIPLDRWVHLRLEVLGTRARIFLDDMEQPALLVSDLKRGSSGGFVGVTAPPDGRVHFSNFRLSSPEGLDFGLRPTRIFAGGNLDQWEISQPMAPHRINRDRSPIGQDLGQVEWRKVTADRTGLVDVARHLEGPPQLPGCILARTTISSAAAERRKLAFGYSDEVSVFLNGELLFRGDSTFRVRDTEFMGIIGFNDFVILDLVEGDNELALVLTESFGGWGFMARLEDLRSDPIFTAEGVTRKWQVQEGLVMPESATWDADKGVFYVSNMNPAGAAGYGDTGYVVRVTTDGEMLEPQWVTGLSGPTGVAVVGDRLYVVERPGVAVIDTNEGTIVERYPIATEGGFLNDLAVHDNGVVFVSDSRLGAIYRVTGEGSELWLRHESIAGANGLVVEGGRLVVTTMGSESLVSIDLEDREIAEIFDLRPFGGDGIASDGSGAFLVSDYTGLLLRLTLTGERSVLIDSRDAGISLTDFAFAPERSLALVPTLRGNTSLAFRLE
jgi:sugar lactone lactonase YvrE